jgi:hypothetical protein
MDRRAFLQMVGAAPLVAALRPWQPPAAKYDAWLVQHNLLAADGTIPCIYMGEANYDSPLSLEMVRDPAVAEDIARRWTITYAR